jgi:hypothetical protein
VGEEIFYCVGGRGGYGFPTDGNQFKKHTETKTKNCKDKKMANWYRYQFTNQHIKPGLTGSCKNVEVSLQATNIYVDTYDSFSNRPHPQTKLMQMGHFLA